MVKEARNINKTSIDKICSKFVQEEQFFYELF